MPNSISLDIICVCRFFWFNGSADPVLGLSDSVGDTSRGYCRQYRYVSSVIVWVILAVAIVGSIGTYPQ